MHATDRTLSLIRRCLLHRSALIRSTAIHGILFARAMSSVGRSLIFCMRRYDFSQCNFMSERIDLRHVKRHFNASVAKNRSLRQSFYKNWLNSVRESYL